jgi:predicted dehydrogenase
MTSYPLNVALIGLGMVADTHLRAIADLSDKLVLRGICARSQQTMAGFSQQVKGLCGHEPICYQSVDAIADDGAIDFAIVLTPPNARQGIVRTLAAAGKHILMEKPVERDSAAALEIIETCEANKIRLGIVFQHRVREASLKLLELIQGPSLGKLGLVEVVVPWWRDQSYYDEPGRGTYERDGGGVLISQAIHTLDLLISLVGDVDEVQAMARTTRFHNMESEDYVTAGMDFSCGATGSLVASTASFPGEAESIVLHFDNAVVALKSGILTLNWRNGRTEAFGADATTGGGADPMAFTHAWHQGVIEDFADAIIQNRAPLVPGREALKVHALIDALIRSSQTKSAVRVALPGTN